MYLKKNDLNENVFDKDQIVDYFQRVVFVSFMNFSAIEACKQMSSSSLYLVKIFSID